jgi:hypothetical protein
MLNALRVAAGRLPCSMQFMAMVSSAATSSPRCPSNSGLAVSVHDTDASIRPPGCVVFGATISALTAANTFVPPHCACAEPNALGITPSSRWMDRDARRSRPSGRTPCSTPRVTNSRSAADRSCIAPRVAPPPPPSAPPAGAPAPNPAPGAPTATPLLAILLLFALPPAVLSCASCLRSST